MKKIVPVLGLVLFLVIVGVWLSKPSTTLIPNAVSAQEDQGQDNQSNESSPETTAGDSEETPATETAHEDSDTATSEVVAIPEGFSEVEPLSAEQEQVFDQAEEVLDPAKDYQALLVTTKGTIRADLFEEKAPRTVNNFVFLSLHKFYDGIVFHRVLEDFMAQTGDPTGTGRGGPGYQFDDEFDASLRHDKPGMLSMANSGPNTNGSQFFITFVETPWLDDKHSVFGEVVEGSDVLDKLTRIDPSNNVPGIIVNLDAPLADLKEKGLAVEGDDSETVEDFLRTSLGELPEMGSSFKLLDYDAVVGRVGETPALGVYLDSPDKITKVIIIEQPKSE
ncbi:MAG: peptidylprolyl isomerase [Trueperaceae bacterium]|nr:peptidylprolyl isomerase [Trueperaceae bacterium]